ncbi:hypothetical protein [Streptomyces platensis]|uniref:hypothetical protein n=1 Tax=Streptomyces platensis TaxID=58346 RepID=UPI00386EFBAE|nr:hypothetical protein OG962_36305 [Streptomyces platensis]
MGVPVAGATGTTVAVTVIRSPDVEGLGVEITVVEVVARVTVWVSVPVEPLKPASPP